MGRLSLKQAQQNQQTPHIFCYVHPHLFQAKRLMTAQRVIWVIAVCFPLVGKIPMEGMVSQRLYQLSNGIPWAR